MAEPMTDTPNVIEIPQFPGGKRIAVTTSFDDGRVYDRKIVEAFNEWGLKGTFNLNSGKLTKGAPLSLESGKCLATSEVALLFKGHEVAIHTVNHTFLDRLDRPQIATQVLDDRKALEDLVQYPVRGMAYPYGTYNQQVIDVLRSLGIVYCRTVENREQCFPVAEPLAWPATMHQFNENPLPLPARWEQFHARPQVGRVFFVWGHSYEFADRSDWDALPRLFKPLAGKPDVWYCTNIELFDYHAARERLVIAANRRTAFNPSGLAVTVKVDGRLVEVPAGATVGLTATAGPES